MTDRRDGFPRPGTGPGNGSARPGDPQRAREGSGEDATILRSALRQGRGDGGRANAGGPQQPPPRRTSEDHWAAPTPQQPAPNQPVTNQPPPQRPADPQGIRTGSGQLPPSGPTAYPQHQASATPPPPPAAVPVPGPADDDDDESGERPAGHRVRTRDGAELVVPLPGRRLSDARSAAKLFRGLAVAALVLSVLAAAAVGGFLAVLATRGLPQGGRTGTQADTFNADAAAVFGSQYLRYCLARGGADDANRLSSARAMSTVDDPACSAAGESRPRRIDSVQFNGTVQPVQGMSRARYLGFSTMGSDGQASYLVPIYLDDPATGAGPRVSGMIGMMASGGYGQPAADDPNAGQPLTDLDLAAVMKSSFLPEFLGAWASSSDSLSQYLTQNATESARAGLNGALKQLQVTDVVALPPKSAHQGGQRFDYGNGARVELQVEVSANSSSQTNQPYAYRVIVEQNGGKWFVADVQAAVAKVPSGAAPPPPRTTTRPSGSATPR
ncbi:conjugal transfer protein [Enemella evansiae]|uniref:conjugal transfer protein n=1 Tax=Enemella evansiae TaxID=2016499 RepID=UPI00105D71EA|nr:conjugal transfer protein [Enemella evansiae]TDO89861.1 conjugative transposon protein TcpC [Enemella evansiae]